MGGYQSNKNKKIDMNDVTYLMITKLGKHYRNKLTNKQYLLIQQIYDKGNNITNEKERIVQYINERKKIKNKNIPQIIQFIQNQFIFCQILPGFHLWIRHPLKSLAEEIQERLQVKEPFQQGEIWMIIHSVVMALICYSNFGIHLKLSEQIIFISSNGDIVVSDANIYSSGRYMRQKDRKRDPIQNIRILLEIIQKILNMELQKKLSYSNQLYLFLSHIKQMEINNYHNILPKIVYYKTQLQESKQYKQSKFKTDALTKQKFITFAQSQYLSNQSINKGQSGEQSSALTQIQCENRINAFEETPQKTKNYSMNKNIKANNYKLYKNTQTTIKAWQKIQNLNRTQSITLHKNDKIWNSLLDLSTINEANKFMIQNQIKDPIDHIFRQQKLKKGISSVNLFQKNKQFLQGLIMQEKNMILQVPESQYDVESVKSIISPSRRISNLSVHSLNTIPENSSSNELF